MNKALKALLLTVAGTGLVSLLKSQQLYIAVLLSLVVILYLVRIWWRTRSWSIIARESFYFITFGTIGYLTESWGTSHGHWTYYYLPDGQQVPTWVPIAWSIAAMLLGKTEEAIEEAQHKLSWLKSMRLRRIMIYTSGMLLPLTGEAICIAYGVWEYHWPLKIIGVPLLALILIAYAHFVFSLIRAGSEKYWRQAGG